MDLKIKEFEDECVQRVESYKENIPLQEAAKAFSRESVLAKYSYNFSWLGRPVIQYPQDLVAMQEIIWRTKPDLIIETGIAHGGSLMFYASMLEMLGHGLVLGIDVDIRQHNRIEIENHPMFKRIRMIEGSSIDPFIVSEVLEIAKSSQKVLVVLDSNHCQQHVLEELACYAPLVSLGSYCVVLDTIIEDMEEDSFPDRPWGKGNNPKTAVYQFLKSNPQFVIDDWVQNKLLISVAHDGYLKRVS